MYINFETTGYKGCINLKNNDLYLAKVSPKYRRILNWANLEYNAENKDIDREVHEAIKEIKK